MLAPILPPGVASQECFGDPCGGALFPEEERAVASAVEARRREYATVRRLARTCLLRLGLPAAPLPPGVGGAPVWPPGAHGSMTHCTGYAATAVARAGQLRAIGIDAEPDLPLPEGVLDLVATPAERDRLDRCPVWPGAPCWDRLLFSAKESVFKALFPATSEWLEPTETPIRLDPHRGTFTASLADGRLLLHGRPVTRVPGRWTRDRGILQTAVVLL